MCEEAQGGFLGVDTTRTYLIPKHCLLPLLNGTKDLSSPGFLIHLSGLNSLGLGKIVSFIKTSTVVMDTGVFLGMAHCPYRSSVSGANLGFRVETPWARRTAS